MNNPQTGTSVYVRRHRPDGSMMVVPCVMSMLAPEDFDDAARIHDEVAHGLSFYSKTRVMTVDELGELAYGAKQPEGEGWFPDKSRFLRMWDSGARDIILAVEKGGRYDSLFKGRETNASKTIDAGKYIILVKRKDVGK